MEVLQNGLFWEVNERVVAFDWVEEPLRAEIPRLRAALKRAKASGRAPAFELETMEAIPAIPAILVAPSEHNGKPNDGTALPVSQETATGG